MSRGDMASVRIEDLEEQLDSFDPIERNAALLEMGRRIRAGIVQLLPVKNEVNLHYHTFFSFNANGWSPERVAWEARKYGLAVAGIVDFDVLDGMEGFLHAGEVLGIRSTVALETRVFISELMDHVINSPNEPGIAYFMASGCFRHPEDGTQAEKILDSMRQMARRRNVQVMRKVNEYLDSVQIDYVADVLPLTPSGNATERHMLSAYDAKSREVFTNPEQLASFWGMKLNLAQHEAAELLANTPKLRDKIRSGLMKFGGVGYVPPTKDTFPQIETVIEMIRGIDALPMATWLDGTNSGEADTLAMLTALESKGVVAVNMIPDRNWNIKDSNEKRIKVENLGKAVSAARKMDFPLCIGTEMNKAGLAFVDNFAACELQPYISDFLEGAYFLWGHTFLARYAEIGCASEWAQSHFGSDRKKKNEFYAKVGRLAEPGRIQTQNLESASPREVLSMLEP